MKTNQLDLNKLGLKEAENLEEIEGGVIHAIALGLGVLSGVALLAYGAGYLYGKATCDC